MPQRIVVLGAGFAGLWSALGAARELDKRGIGPEQVEILVIERTGHHSIRVRDYETDISETVIPLSSVLDPTGVRHLQADITDIDLAARHVRCRAKDGDATVSYDRMVFALGSHVRRPPIRGLAEYAFDVDTYEGAVRLNEHIAGLPSRPDAPGRYTVVVVGAGLTGIEASAEMPAKLTNAGCSRGRMVLVDHAPRIGSDLGAEAIPIVEQALGALGVELRPGRSVAAVDEAGVTLAGGERIAAATVVWCAGLEAHPLTAQFPIRRDRFGRLPVDQNLKVKGVDGVFAAGDAAHFMIDGTHESVMSCQHGRPMGRFAGHNVVCDLLGGEMLPLHIDWYVTVLDLGAWGALYMEGWDRHVAVRGEAAKKTKQIINRQRIYPPLSGDRRALLDAAAPVVQASPPQGHA